MTFDNLQQTDLFTPYVLDSSLAGDLNKCGNPRAANVKAVIEGVMSINSTASGPHKDTEEDLGGYDEEMDWMPSEWEE